MSCHLTSVRSSELSVSYRLLDFHYAESRYYQLRASANDVFGRLSELMKRIQLLDPADVEAKIKFDSIHSGKHYQLSITRLGPMPPHSMSPRVISNNFISIRADLLFSLGRPRGTLRTV